MGRKVFIELKYKFDSTSKLQRLIGQLAIYKKEKVDCIIIVLCGTSDNQLLKQLSKEVHDINDEIGFLEVIGSGPIFIIKK